MVFDTEAHKEEARFELLEMINGLPAEYKFPRVKRQNRYLIELENDTRINLAAAGAKVTKTTSTLGRSSGINFVHACLHPDTEVLVDHGRVKRIRDVKVGDRVVTHTGAAAAVVANVGKANDRGPMRRITPWLGDALLCTLDHKIQTDRGLIEARDICKSDVVCMPVRPISDLVKTSLLPGPRLRVQHGGSVAAAAGAAVAICEELGFAIGYYLAEGCMTYQGRGVDYYRDPAGIIFTRHRNEAAYANRAIKALEPYTTGHRATTDVTGSLSTREQIYGSSLASWIQGLFGAQDGKRIPDDVFNWGPEFCRGLLCGLLSGDGSKQLSKLKGGYVVNRVQLTTTRASLAYQARDIAASLGYGWARISRRSAGVIYGRNCKESWTVSWCGSAASSLRKLMGLESAPISRDWLEKYKIEGGAVKIKIRSIEDGVDQPFMYDLSVDHPDHTFRTTSMCVSNSEICSWGDPEAVEAFKAALAQDFENRLYVWESTAKGFNLWKDIWDEAKEDSDHQYTVFTGWWGKDNQIIRKTDPDFERYGVQPPTEEELRKIELVKQDYGWEITEEQLAWIRRAMAPGAKAEGDAPIEFEGSATRIQENPWHETEAFQMTGAVFFAPEKLKEQADHFVSNKFSTWMYQPGLEFHEMKVYKAVNTRSIELKVWEEPEPNAVYILAIDPAFGHDEENDRSAIQVLRAYADGLDQVAEYAWPLITTNHLAWVAASLMGWYGGEHSEVYMILEIQGPGDGVLTEFKQLRHRLEAGYQSKDAAERGLRDVFRNVKNYFYWRTDSLSPGRSLHWKTNSTNKVGLMERLRDFTSNGMLRVRSMSTLEEMRSVTREGDQIAAQGRNKDDRVMALAMAIRCWEDRVRRMLVTQKRTRENEEARRKITPIDQARLFSQFQIDQFMNQRRAERRDANRIIRRSSWRNR